MMHAFLSYSIHVYLIRVLIDSGNYSIVEEPFEVTYHHPGHRTPGPTEIGVSFT